MYTLSFTEDGEVVSTYQFIYENLSDSSISTTIEGKGAKEVKVSITSAQSGLTATLGTYTFDYSNNTFSVLSEDIAGALDSVTLAAAATTEPVTQAENEVNYADPSYYGDDNTAVEG